MATWSANSSAPSGMNILKGLFTHNASCLYEVLAVCCLQPLTKTALLANLRNKLHVASDAKPHKELLLFSVPSVMFRR